MLQLKNIKKSYTTAGFTQNALDGVSVAFRDNEFAAVLGPSGSGKTTMLNIIGGLDQYDSGDLEIDGISTKNYKAGDWDTYRNNRIGFVFQSYNLIPHQNVLANVELALTLSGVSKSERRRRAKEALEQVGLGEHIRKKPNQLSGGQMQRVAIARALINDPEILLADEPTGALDSKTSLQVMELLTKIAKDRCVIMVTHNNELAEQYANRLVHLTDGVVTSDSHPFDPNAEKQRQATPPRRSRMSFFTAIALSFSNLMTKKGRTFTTAFAGSIGIIGIATIMAFSNGINAYIAGIEEDTLSLYPLAIQQQSFDLSGFFGGSGDDDGEEPASGWRERPEGTVREVQVMETVFSSQSSNDLAALKIHMDANEDYLKNYVTTIDYTYDITPQIYLSDTTHGADRVNPDSLFSGVMGMSELPSVAGMGPGAMMNIFYELPNEPDLYESQYEVLAGHWPQNYDEAVLVLQWGHRVVDFTLYSLGMRDREEMRAMFESFMEGSDLDFDVSESELFYPYESFLSQVFKVVVPADTYHYDEIYEIWVDKSGDDKFMKDVLDKSMDLKIVGIVQPTEDASTTVLSPGINYTGDLVFHLIDEAKNRPIVKEQIEKPLFNVISGNTFYYEEKYPPNTFDFSRIISVDEDVFQDSMGFDALTDVFDFEGMDFDSLDMSGFNLNNFDMGSMMGFNNLSLNEIDFGDTDVFDLEFDFSSVPVPQLDFADAADSIAKALGINPNDLQAVMLVVMSEFFNSLDPIEFAGAIAEDKLGEYLIAQFQIYMPTAISTISDALNVDSETVGDQISEVIMTTMAGTMQGYILQMVDMIESRIRNMMEDVMRELADSMQDAMKQVTNQITRAMRNVTKEIEDAIAQVFDDIVAEMEASIEDFDGESLAEAFQIEMSEEDILELMTAMMNPSTTSYEKNLSMLGYADTTNPTQIMIYPLSFEAKEVVLEFLDDYNSEMERTGQQEKVVNFTDIVGMMMSSVTDIVDIVSYALVAFVSVSLVVSSIMIGVITFVSVLERKKEIGILRAVGASKGNIRLVFNAETLIIGFVAGLIGVIATYFIVIIANIILDNLLGINNLVIMAPMVPFLLIGISMFLTFLAGLVPAQAAASRPPVEALRSE